MTASRNLGLPGFVAGGTIAPKRFMKLSTSADNTVLQAGAGDYPIGVSQPGQRDTPGLTGSDTAVAANSGDMLTNMAGVGETALVTVGTGGTTRGAFVKSDASGQAVLLTTLAGSGSTAVLQNSCGIALRAVAAGLDCLVLFLPQQISQ